MEEILAVVEVVPLERIFERTEEQIDDLTVQQVVRRFSHWTRPFFRSDRIFDHIVAQCVDLAVPQVVKRTLEVVIAIPRSALPSIWWRRVFTSPCHKS